jgi:predicted TIM-barrel fold metal-dependent hydrolase
MCPTTNSAYNVAICRAINAWQADTWLSRYDPDERFRGSIAVTTEDPEAAVVEIEQWAGNPRFVQIFISHHSERPLGHPRFDPIWRAAARNALPVAMHVNVGGAESMLTPTGPLQHYVEYHALAFPLAYAAHLVSWICEGTFEKFPDFRVVLVEGGFFWAMPLIARLSARWESGRRELPNLRRDPIDYLRQHVRFTSQPIEEPSDPRDLVTWFDLSHAAELLMFATDYPHYDYDSPTRAFPPQLSAPVRDRIMAGNALDWYRLPRTRAGLA